MNKKNFPIFASVFIVSLFFTFVLYYAKVNLDYNYKSTRADAYADALIEEEISKEELKSLSKMEGIDIVGHKNFDLTSGLFNGDLIAISKQDKNINQMREYSWIKSGRFPENPKEIVLSESLVDKYSLALGDDVNISLGNRKLDGQVLRPSSTKVDGEDFDKEESKTYELVGVYEDVYNKYSNISYGLIYEKSSAALPALIKFDDFLEAYNNKENIEVQIEELLDRDIDLTFNDDLISYFRADEDPLRELLAKSVMIISLIVMVVIFIFFVRNIFWVWGLRKIRDLSVYKSIGSTNFQIYALLLREAFLISALPLVLGHLGGFGLIYGLYEYGRGIWEVSKYEYVTYSLPLSGIVLALAIIVIAFSIIKTAKNISRINIIDGIKGNIDISSSKKKTNPDMWKELRINNLASIKSQRNISAIGVFIVAMFILVISINEYFRDYYAFDDGYNTNLYYFSPNNQVPDILKEIESDIDNEKSFIYTNARLTMRNNLALSSEARASKLEDEMGKYLEDDSLVNVDLIGMDEKDLLNLGGSRGDFLIYNKVQADPSEPIEGARMVKYFEDPRTIAIETNGADKKVEIAKAIYDTASYRIKPYPFVVNIFTDYETYFDLTRDINDNPGLPYTYMLNMQIKDEDTTKAKEYMENKLTEAVGPNEGFNILVDKEIEAKENSSLRLFQAMILAIGLIILILNITNGYSSINISLISRQKEIASLYSAGMELGDLKNKYEKDFALDQVISFGLVALITFIVMVIIAILSPKLSLAILVKYYNYLTFLGFAILIYTINLLIYHFSLKRILERPTIELIRTI